MPENPRIEELRRRVLADPASIAFAALAEEFRRVGALTDAIETCRTGLQRHPAYLSARVTLGRALIETGEYDAAREEFETVLRSAPENLAAIRGLEQISERLGHSTEMDPHLAALMREEAVRVAMLPPPPPPPAPEPVLAALPQEVEPEPEPAITAPPQPQAAATDIDAELEPEDVFAIQLEPEPQAEPVFAIQLEPEPQAEPVFAIQLEPEPQAGPVFAIQLEPEPEPVFAVPLEPQRESVFAIQLEPEPGPGPIFALEPAIETEPERVLHPAAPAPVGDLDLAPDYGPDPQMLATLARLERFLAAVETARHA